MNFWPALSSWHFALAGAVAAAGPVIIHLLNRRRYRVVHWAAMDFLREAIQRNRRILQIRDLVLLALRTLAVLLFGLALARPYFAANAEKFDGTQPLHAVLLIDNSLSMGYQTLAGTLLDEAKTRAREFIDKLPHGSRVTVVPLCGSASGASPDPYDTEEAAMEAVGRIEVVDRATTARQAINEARRACEAVPELAKRLVLIGDQQRTNWSDWQPDALEGLPALQVVHVRADAWDNTSINELRLPDGLADTETPTTILVEVQHRGTQPRRDVQVTLWVEDRPVASQTITLEAGEGTRQLSFQHVFDDQAPAAGREQFVAIKATLSPDNLAADDERHLLVPVVAALPVVFVDQFGPDEEDPVRRRLGETRHLRTLLAPRLAKSDSPPLIKVRHLKIGELSRDVLADARLVVIAGIHDPAESVDLLREFVEQGGQLLIAAGGEFDAESWERAAWRDGAGILPLPLKAPLGATPEEAGPRINAFQLNIEGLSAHDYFQLPDVSENDMRDLYSEPFFFKAIEVDASDEVLKSLRETEMKRLADEREKRLKQQERGQLARAKSSTANASATETNTATTTNEAGAASSNSDAKSSTDVETEATRWLQWSREDAEEPVVLNLAPAEVTKELEAAALRLAPRVIARYATERSPAFLVERPIGAGEVVFVSTGLLSDWSTLPKTNMMFIFDRLLRGMIQETLSRRNFDPRARLAIPLPGADPREAIRLQRPGHVGPDEELDLGFVGRDIRGVTIPAALQRGDYRLFVAHSDAAGGNGAGGSSASGAGESPWTPLITVAVNGAAEESDLTPLGEDRREAIVADPRVRWVSTGEGISLAGAQLRGQDSWWYLVLLVLAALLLEILILLRGNWSASATAPRTETA